MTNKVYTGKVKWFNTTKGYGFIQPEDGSKDVFIHITALEDSRIRTLDENETIQYEVASNNGKVSAINIKKIAKKA